MGSGLPRGGSVSARMRFRHLDGSTAYGGILCDCRTIIGLLSRQDGLCRHTATTAPSLDHRSPTHVRPFQY